MKAIVANNVLDELRQAVLKGQPAFSTERGQLFVVPGLPMAAIKLMIPMGEYLDFIWKLDQDVRPEISWIVPQHQAQEFHVVVKVPIQIINGQTVADDNGTDRPVVIL